MQTRSITRKLANAFATNSNVSNDRSGKNTAHPRSKIAKKDKNDKSKNKLKNSIPTDKMTVGANKRRSQRLIAEEEKSVQNDKKVTKLEETSSFCLDEPRDEKIKNTQPLLPKSKRSNSTRSTIEEVTEEERELTGKESEVTGKQREVKKDKKEVTEDKSQVTEEKRELTRKTREVTGKEGEVKKEKREVTGKRREAEVKREATEDKSERRKEKGEVTGKRREAEVKREVTEDKSERRKEKREVTGKQRELREEERGITEEKIEVTKDKSEVTEEKRELTRKRREITRKQREVKKEKREVTEEKREITGKKSEVTGKQREAEEKREVTGEVKQEVSNNSTICLESPPKPKKIKVEANADVMAEESESKVSPAEHPSSPRKESISVIKKEFDCHVRLSDVIMEVKNENVSPKTEEFSEPTKSDQALAVSEKEENVEATQETQNKDAEQSSEEETEEKSVNGLEVKRVEIASTSVSVKKNSDKPEGPVLQGFDIRVEKLPEDFLNSVREKRLVVGGSQCEQKKDRKKQMKGSLKRKITDGKNYIPLDSGGSTKFFVADMEMLKKSGFHHPAIDVKRDLLYGPRIKRVPYSTILAYNMKQECRTMRY